MRVQRRSVAPGFFRKQLTGLAVFALFAIHFGCTPMLPAAGVPEAGAYIREMNIRAYGLYRSYHIHVPKGIDPDEPLPLVIAVHGVCCTGTELEKYTGFSKLADREKFVVVYPNGVGLFGFFQHWNSGHCCGLAMADDLDDVGFISEVIRDVCNRFNIDDSRIYMAGHSNGGMLAYRYAAERPEDLAAVACVAATIGGKPSEDDPEWRIPEPKGRVPLLVMHGQEDGIVPFAGGRSTARPGTRTYISVSECIRCWIEANGCDSQPERKWSPWDRIIWTSWKSESGNDVVLCSIKGWDHFWPGRYFVDHLCANDSLKGFDGSEMIWKFFKDYQKTRGKTTKLDQGAHGCKGLQNGARPTPESTDRKRL